MKYLNFHKDNILNYQAVKIDIDEITEVFAYVKLVQGERMNPIEAELDAIDKVNAVKQFHKDNNIEKSEAYYRCFKMQALDLNDRGIVRHSEHIFKDYNGLNCQLILN